MAMNSDKCTCDIREIGIIISHPFGIDHGGIKTTLYEWMEIGPGPRNNVRPIKAFCMKCGAALGLDVIPLKYRNNIESRQLIEKGIIPDPWVRV